MPGRFLPHLALVIAATVPLAASAGDAETLSETIDSRIRADLDEMGVRLSDRSLDEDFLRRVSFDLAGRAPTPREITLFGLDPSSDKRARVIDRLLDSDDYAANWARYWRDVILTRATDQRAGLARAPFETWMTEQLRENTGWNEIVSDILTATGDVRETGATILVFAHNGDAKELAAEVSRIFLGIQLQCANCHDHPTDDWKRPQFHELAAYFPRVRVRRRQMDGARPTFEVVSFNGNGGRRRNAANFNPEQFFRRFDRDDDGQLSREELQRTPLRRNLGGILRRMDGDKNGQLSLKELKGLQQLPGQRNRVTEYFMPDLNDPASRGARVDPAFFATGVSGPVEANDLERRRALASAITSQENPWFRRAFVNRIWSELVGNAFVTPLDDMGPSRETAFPDVLETLSEAWVENGHDVKWLMRTITATDTYQRRIADTDPAEEGAGFTAATASPLRADQLYDAITKVFGIRELGNGQPRNRGGANRYNRGGARAQFANLFGFDPSTPADEIVATIPQALFMMNSPLLNRLIQATGNSRLARILREQPDDEDALHELYLVVLAREPSDREVRICLEFVQGLDNRQEAFEDVMWSLLNSSEFRSKR